MVNSTIKLPVKMQDSKYMLDPNITYSDEGYIPDWEFMDTYMKGLPYGDRI